MNRSNVIGINTNAIFSASTALFDTITSHFTGDFVQLPKHWKSKITIGGETYTYRQKDMWAPTAVFPFVLSVILLVLLQLSAFFGRPVLDSIYTATIFII